MNQTLQQLKDASSGLPAPQRAELAHFLLQSLEPDDLASVLLPPEPPQEEGWAEAWQEELSRRLDEIRSGKVVGVPAEEVLGRLQERYP